MESKIKWHTIEQKENGTYLVTIKDLQDNLFVTFAYYACLKEWSPWKKE